MPSFVPRNLEPYQKREILEKRWSALRGALNAGATAERVANAAEKVRLAALAVIKAQRSILDGQRETEAVTRQLVNLQQDEDCWRSLSVEAIVSQVIDGKQEKERG